MPPLQETAPDLEQLRDDRVFPVARAVLKDMAESLLPDDANEKIDYNPIVTKILQRSLDADFNITTEAQYLFQVLLGVFAALNSTVRNAVTIPIDDVRYGNIGARILSLVADADVTLGSVTPDQVIQDFAPIQAKVNELFAAEQLSMLEVKYIMDNIFTSFNTVNNLYSKSLEKNTAIAEAKLFGVEDMSDLTLGRVEEVLKQTIIPASALEDAPPEGEAMPPEG